MSLSTIFTTSRTFPRGSATCRQCTYGASWFRSLLNYNFVLLRRNAIGHHLQVTLTGFHVGRYVQVGGRGTRVANRHGAVVMGAAVENVAGGKVGNAHDGIIGGVL